MRIQSFIERVREKPKAMRAQVSFLCALCVTGVVALLWGASLPARLARTPLSGEAAGQEDLGSFFADAQNNVAGLFGAVQGETPASAPFGADAGAPASPSGAYHPGVPAPEPSGYYDTPFESAPSVVPVSREVRIGTTTSTSKALE